MYEVIIGMVIGFFISWLAQMIVFPLFGIHVPQSTQVSLIVIYTVISIIRTYYVRRLFNLLHVKGIL